MRERKRKHDDAHCPMGGKGRRARKPKAILPPCDPCPGCGRRISFPHLCLEHFPKSERGR